MKIPTGALTIDTQGIGWIYSWGVWFMASHFNSTSGEKR
jgi:hypothetical protein